MRKSLNLFLIAVCVLYCNSLSSQPTDSLIYHFKVPSLIGNEINFSSFQGKKILIVNIASNTKDSVQITQLQQLQEQFQNTLVVVSFPSKDFTPDDPATDAEIVSKWKSGNRIKYPMGITLRVTGSGMHPLYKWLTKKEKNGMLDATVKGNFQKFLINENGKLVGVFDASVSPLDPRLVRILGL